MRQINEGYMPFMGYQTYYRTVGEKTSDKAPIILLHGGPGSTHNYMETLDAIADTGRLVISYDQLGCGLSYIDGHPELWNKDTWIDELICLRDYLELDTCHILGQSWGGMLALSYMIDRKPEGVKSLILSSTLSASHLWSHEQHRRIKFMSPEDREAIANAEATGDYESAAYKLANAHFMKRYCAGSPKETDPECLRRPKKYGDEAYLYAWGPNEYTPSGTLKDFDYTDRLGEIDIPALIVSGTNDLCAPLIAKTMYDGIPNSKWELFDGARHMCFVEQNEKYVQMLTEWLSDHD